MQADTPAQLPPLPQPDQDALLLFLSRRQDPVATANEARLHYAHILEWSSRPDIAAYIEHHRSLRANLFRDAAIEHLDRIMRTTRDETIRCRAAIGFLRATDPARFNTRPAKRTASPPAHTKNHAGAAPPPHQTAQDNGHFPTHNKPATNVAPNEPANVPAANEPAAQARENQSEPAPIVPAAQASEKQTIAPDDPGINPASPRGPEPHPDAPLDDNHYPVSPEPETPPTLHDPRNEDPDLAEDPDPDLDDDEDWDDDCDEDEDDWDDDDCDDDDFDDEVQDDHELLNTDLQPPDPHAIQPRTANPDSPEPIPRTHPPESPH